MQEPVTDDVAGGDQACGAEKWQDLVGKPLAVAQTMPWNKLTRWIGPGSRVTMDFVPSRLNIIHDEGGIITAVRCG